MPRPRIGVTIKNVLDVDRYFSRALKENRLFSKNSAKNFDLFYAAREAFNRLPALEWKSEATKKAALESRQAALQQWIDEHVPPEKWQRCLLTLRQNKSRKKLKLRHLDLPLETYLTVKILAKKKNLSMAELVQKLAEPALNKFYKRELNKKSG